MVAAAAAAALAQTSASACDPTHRGDSLADSQMVRFLETRLCLLGESDFFTLEWPMWREREDPSPAARPATSDPAAQYGRHLIASYERARQRRNADRALREAYETH